MFSRDPTGERVPIQWIAIHGLPVDATIPFPPP